MKRIGKVSRGHRGSGRSIKSLANRAWSVQVIRVGIA